MRLIDADLIQYEPMLSAKGNGMYEDVMVAYKSQIDGLPTIEERKKGKWEITEAYPHNVYCSECHHKFAQTHWAVWEDGTLPRNYCPNCGADMRGLNDGE